MPRAAPETRNARGPLILAKLQLYAIVGLLLITLGGSIYVNHLRNKVSTQSTRIVDLEATELGLRAGQVVLENTQRQRIETVKTMGAIKRDIAIEEDTSLPAPIERALDGLRQHQNRRNP